MKRLVIELCTTLRYRIVRWILPLFDRSDYVGPEVTKRYRVKDSARL